VGCGAPRGRDLDVPGRKEAAAHIHISASTGWPPYRSGTSPACHPASSCWEAAIPPWTAAVPRADSAAPT
jgi:hypothetical protein